MQLHYNEIGDKRTQSGNDTHLSKTAEGKMAIPKMTSRKESSIVVTGST